MVSPPIDAKDCAETGAKTIRVWTRYQKDRDKAAALDPERRSDEVRRATSHKAFLEWLMAEMIAAEQTSQDEGGGSNCSLLFALEQKK